MRIKIVLFSLLLISAALPACTPYKMEIRQGNYVTAEMRAKLQPGMTRQQVRMVVGTPMISDVFHENRWDYIYRLEQDHELIEHKSMTLYFEGDVLSRIVDDEALIQNTPAPQDQ